MSLQNRVNCIFVLAYFSRLRCQGTRDYVKQRARSSGPCQVLRPLRKRGSQYVGRVAPCGRCCFSVGAETRRSTCSQIIQSPPTLGKEHPCLYSTHKSIKAHVLILKKRQNVTQLNPQPSKTIPKLLALSFPAVTGSNLCWVRFVYRIMVSRL